MLGVRSPDPLLSVAATIGLATAAGTALVIDLASPPMTLGRRNLRDMASDGPTLADLSPGRSGVALVSGGGIGSDEASALVGRLATRWPALVVRVDSDGWPFPVVPVLPLYPGPLAPFPDTRAGVWQPLSAGARPPGPGPVLPRLRPGALRRILNGRPPRRDGWQRAWAPIWSMPWA